MKTKNKTLALVEIAIVLCSILLVALPSIAAEQVAQKASASTSAITTTASEDDDTFTLGIYGNANEDDTIDMRDTTYIKLVIFGKKAKTDLADANNDGKVSMLDVGQTKLIILGKEKELTIKDLDRAVTIRKPVTRIIVTYYAHVAIIRTVGATDRVVGVGDSMQKQPKFFPELSKKPSIGPSLTRNPDVEAILELEPDILVVGSRPTPELEDKLKGTDIKVVHVDTTDTGLLGSTMKLGYIFDEQENAREYIEWHNKYMNEIKEKVSGIPEDEKVNVFIDASSGKEAVGFIKAYMGESGPGAAVRIAGGKNIAYDLPGSMPMVEVEWVIKQNPDVIIGRQYAVGYETDDVSEIKAHYEHLMGGYPGFERITAVKENRVYMGYSIILWGPGYVIGTAYIAKWFYPDLFEDLNPVAIHQEYIDRFQRIDFDVREHGVFVYHPELHPEGW